MKNKSLQILLFIACLTPFSLYAQQVYYDNQQQPYYTYTYASNGGYNYTYTNPPRVHTVEPGNYSYSPESIPNRVNFRVYTGGARGPQADMIAFHVFRNFLYNNDYSYYNVVRKPTYYRSPYSVYTVDFYRSSKVGYGY